MSDILSAVTADSHALFTAVLERLAKRESLSATQAEEAFGVIMDGAVSSERIAAFLMALRVRGETPDELLGAVTALRQRMNAVPDLPDNTVDVCGTGGTITGR